MGVQILDIEFILADHKYLLFRIVFNSACVTLHFGLQQYFVSFGRETLLLEAFSFLSSDFAIALGS